MIILELNESNRKFDQSVKQLKIIIFRKIFSFRLVMSSGHKKSKNTSVNTSAVKSHIVTLANDLLQICQIGEFNGDAPKRIDTINQLSAHVYVYFYENICNTELIGKFKP